MIKITVRLSQLLNAIRGEHRLQEPEGAGKTDEDDSNGVEHTIKHVTKESAPAMSTTCDNKTAQTESRTATQADEDVRWREIGFTLRQISEQFSR